MKRFIAAALLVLAGMVFVPSADAQRVYNEPQSIYQDNDRYGRQRRGRRYDRNYGYVVRMEQRYIRIGRRVYREIYRSTYTRYGQLVSRQLVSRERLARYDNYRDNDFRREGIRFGIHFNF